MSKKPPFVALEEAVALAYKKTREMADAMRLDNNALSATAAVEEFARRLGGVLDAHVGNFDKQKKEFESLVIGLFCPVESVLDLVRARERDHHPHVSEIYALDEMHPRLLEIFNEFRPRMM